MNRFFVQFEAFVYVNPPHSIIPAVYFETDEESLPAKPLNLG